MKTNIANNEKTTISAKRYEDLDDFGKNFFDIFRSLPPEDQREVSAAITAAGKITYATPEQVKALCGRLGITGNPFRYICSLSVRHEAAAFWAACGAVDDITDHKTIDELRAIRAAREGAEA